MVDSKTVPNPAYLEWKKKDQILLSWLHTTMRPTVFARVIGYKTARSTWEALDRAYTSQTNARYYQIKHDLYNIRKGSYSITEYMDRIRRLTDELSLIQQPMSGVLHFADVHFPSSYGQRSNLSGWAPPSSCHGLVAYSLCHARYGTRLSHLVVSGI